MSEFLQYLISGAAVGCGFALTGSGLVVIHRVTRVVNLAQGMFAVLAGLTVTSLLGAGVPHLAAEGLAILAAAAAGALTGLIAIGRRGTTPITTLIVTLGIGLAGYAAELLVWGDQPRSFPGLGGAVDIAGAHILRQHLLVIVVTLVVFAGIGVFFGRTYLGKALAACAANPYAARIIGIDVTRMGVVAFALAGALGGLAGVLLTPLQSVAFDSDVPLLVNGFAAAIFGGLLRPGMALAGGLLLGVAQSLVAGFLSGTFQLEVALVLMLAVMIGRTLRRGAATEEEAAWG